MKQQRKAKLSEITIWYKFKPRLTIWFSKMKGKSFLCSQPQQTWYGGYWFNSGYFIFLQFKYFTIHIMIRYWKLELFKK